MKTTVLVKISIPLFVFLAVVCLLTPSVHAQVVEQVKGGKALINMGSQSYTVGTELYTINAQGKRTAIVKIRQVKGQKAIADVIKGSATVGMTLAEKSAAAPSPQTPAKEEQAYQKRKNGHGVLLAFSLDSMALTAANNTTPPTIFENVSFAGSSFKVKYFYDYSWKEQFVIRFSGGLDGFNGKYTASNAAINNNGSTQSNLAANYLSFDAALNWNFYRKPKTQIWTGAGYSFQYLTGVASTLHSLQVQGSFSNVLFFGVGADLWMSSMKSYIPIYFYYNYYMFGTGITASSLNFGAGWGWGK